MNLAKTFSCINFAPALPVLCLQLYYIAVSLRPIKYFTYLDKPVPPEFLSALQLAIQSQRSSLMVPQQALFMFTITWFYFIKKIQQIDFLYTIL